jgi:hypothetical protein
VRRSAGLFVVGLIIAVQVGLALVMPPASASSRTVGVRRATSNPTVDIEPRDVRTTLGRRFTFTSTIRNPAGPSPDTIAHLNVLGLDPDVYVDPEDWSEERTRYLGSLPENSATPVTWTVQAVNSGRFLVYVTLTQPAASDTVSASQALRVAVSAPVRVAAPGALPLAMAVPGAILVLLVLTARRRWARAKPLRAAS